MAPSSTVTVLSFSLDTRTSSADAGAAAARRPTTSGGCGGGEADQRKRHRVSGLSVPSVSSSENWCWKPGCGETDDQLPRPGQQYGLAQLPVPVAEGQARSLEPGQLEFRPAQIGGDRRGIGGARARRRLAQRAHREPGGMVARGHPAIGRGRGSGAGVASRPTARAIAPRASAPGRACRRSVAGPSSAMPGCRPRTPSHRPPPARRRRARLA